MGIFNRWRQFGKRYFWPHLLFGVIAASIGVPSVFDNTEQRALSSSTACNLNRPTGSAQFISTDVLLQSKHLSQYEKYSSWHQRALHRFLTRLASAIVPQSNLAFSAKEPPSDPLSIHEWIAPDSPTKSSPFKLSNAFQSRLYPTERLSIFGQRAGLWLVKQGGLRAGPINITDRISIS